MWSINSSKFTLQEVLIMAYMNVLEGTQRGCREAVRTSTLPGGPRFRRANVLDPFSNLGLMTQDARVRCGQYGLLCPLDFQLKKGA